MERDKFLTLVRAVIAAKDIPKKSLARRCKVSRPQFSEIIHGDREMPEEVRQRLVSELGLEQAIQKMNAREGAAA